METKSSIPIKESLSTSSFQWAFVVERTDVDMSGNNNEIETRCPFSPETRGYIERVFKDAINIAIDDYRIRSFEKLSICLNRIQKTLFEENKMPSMKDIIAIGHPDGVQVVIHLGEGYCSDFLWTEYNDHSSILFDKYKRTGVDKIRTLIDNIVKQHI